MFVTPPSSVAFNRHKVRGLMRLLLAGGALSIAACNSVGPKSEIVVSVKDQKLGLYQDGELKKAYTISTSKFGIGDQPGSYRTPLGKHEVIAKIGHGLPTGAVLKSRHWNGEVLKPNAPGRDPIVSRILWLRGMESANRNAMKRFIYIHGTTEEGNLGKPASFGCIRMGMTDVVDLFNDVGIGAKVEITRTKLPHGHKNADPKPTPEAEQVIAVSNPKEPAPTPAQAPAKPEVKPEARVGPEAPAPEKPASPELAATEPEAQEKAPRREGWKFWSFSKSSDNPVVTDTSAASGSAQADSPVAPKREEPQDSHLAAVQPEASEQAQESRGGGWKFWPFSKSRTADAIDVTDTAVLNPAATPQADIPSPSNSEKPAATPIARSRSKKGGAAYKLEKITTSNRRDTSKSSRLHG